MTGSLMPPGTRHWLWGTWPKQPSWLFPSYERRAIGGEPSSAPRRSRDPPQIGTMTWPKRVRKLWATCVLPLLKRSQSFSRRNFDRRPSKCQALGRYGVTEEAARAIAKIGRDVLSDVLPRLRKALWLFQLFLSSVWLGLRFEDMELFNSTRLSISIVYI